MTLVCGNSPITYHPMRLIQSKSQSGKRKEETEESRNDRKFHSTSTNYYVRKIIYGRTTRHLHPHHSEKQNAQHQHCRCSTSVPSCARSGSNSKRDSEREDTNVESSHHAVASEEETAPWGESDLNLCLTEPHDRDIDMHLSIITTSSSFTEEGPGTRYQSQLGIVISYSERYTYSVKACGNREKHV